MQPLTWPFPGARLPDPADRLYADGFSAACVPAM